MDAFLTAAACVAGGVLGFVITNLFIVAIRIGIAKLDDAAQERYRAKVREYQRQQAVRRLKELEAEADVVLKANPEVARIVTELKAHAYRSGRTAAAKKNNATRSRLQRELRELIPSSELRDWFYKG